MGRIAGSVAGDEQCDGRAHREVGHQIFAATRQRRLGDRGGIMLHQPPLNRRALIRVPAAHALSTPTIVEFHGFSHQGNELHSSPRKQAGMDSAARPCFLKQQQWLCTACPRASWNILSLVMSTLVYDKFWRGKLRTHRLPRPAHA